MLDGGDCTGPKARAGERRAARLARLAAGVAEHLAAGVARLAGTRYFDEVHFERTYAAPDPWAYATSAYEEARRAALLAALPRPRYRSALEVGCGEGHTTRLLASRADRVVGLDISEAALARGRAAGLPPNVSLARGDLLGGWPPRQAPAGAFDLVVCAELLYYCYWLPLGRACRVSRDRLVAWLAPGGDLVLEHPLHYLSHAPFDRLAGGRGGPAWPGRPAEPPLQRLGRRRVAIVPRPVSVAVYRRRAPAGAPGEPAERRHNDSAVVRRPI